MTKGIMKAVRRTLSGITMDDLLYRVGLERRTSPYPKFLLLGIGLLVGAGVGLVLAPKTGREMRAKIADGVKKRTHASNGHERYEEETPGSPRM